MLTTRKAGILYRVVYPEKRQFSEPEDEVQSYINQQFVTKGCQLVHYNVLIDSHNNLVYDFVWLCPDGNAVKEEPPVSQSDVP
jgi:hypothetical protein